jgi:hypothetical protein
MTPPALTSRKRKYFEVLIIGLSVFGLLSGLCQAPSILAAHPQNTCVGIGGWPCGYTGPFTGDYYDGYARLNCVPLVPNGACVVQQVTTVASYLLINGVPYVIDWASQSCRLNSHPVDGSTISLLGRLAPIFYNKTAGSTYVIYYSNAMGLWDPQPKLQIQNATLS